MWYRLLDECAAWMKVAVVPAGGGLPCSGDISVEEVLQAEEARCRAQMNGDVVAMDTLMGNDLVYIHSSTVIDNKRSFIESIRSGAVKYRSMRTRDVTVRCYGCVAIANGRGHFEVTVKGEDRTLDLLFHAVWAKRGESVQFVSWQATRLP